MRYLAFLLSMVLMVSCTEANKAKKITGVEITPIYEDSLSIRAIEIMGGSLAFAANKGVFGTIDLNTGKVRTNVEKYRENTPEFRAIGHTATDFFMLSIANPALLYKTGENGQMQLVYKEEDDSVFYDAMTFWNDREGIAIGDTMNGCLSIIITRDGGNAWEKIPCAQLPASKEGEGAFAASNTNIKTVGDNTWVGTGNSRIFYSPDKGNTWQVFDTPIAKEKTTEGIFSIDFWDENLGIAIGGDYTDRQVNVANKAITVDGGKTWSLVASGKEPDHKSCVRFVPNSDGKGIIAVGATGISYSDNGGESWQKLSHEGFYTIRFLNNFIAYAAGMNRVAKLTFRTE